MHIYIVHYFAIKEPGDGGNKAINAMQYIYSYNESKYIYSNIYYFLIQVQEYLGTKIEPLWNYLRNTFHCNQDQDGNYLHLNNTDKTIFYSYKHCNIVTVHV